jgi:hypothetical protein
MKRADFNRKRNFVAAIALTWTLIFGLMSCQGYCPVIGYGPVILTLPMGVLMGGIFGYGNGLVLYYICRARQGEKFYE